MQELSEISQTIAGMPIGGLVTLVVVAGFGLAAYAIYAVLTVVKERR